MGNAAQISYFCHIAHGNKGKYSTVTHVFCKKICKCKLCLRGVFVVKTVAEFLNPFESFRVSIKLSKILFLLLSQLQLQLTWLKTRNNGQIVLFFFFAFLLLLQSLKLHLHFQSALAESPATTIGQMFYKYHQ